MEDQAVLLVMNGTPHVEVERFCRSQGTDAKEARAIVAQARERITRAADFTRDEQLGKAVMRFEDLYSKAILRRDHRAALQAQRELTRLLGLGGGPAEEAPAAPDDAMARLELIDGYLRPLGLTEDHYPVEEHARVAAEILRQRQET